MDAHKETSNVLNLEQMHKNTWGHDNNHNRYETPYWKGGCDHPFYPSGHKLHRNWRERVTLAGSKWNHQKQRRRWQWGTARDVASASQQQQSSASRLVETNSSSAPGWGWLNNVHSYLLIKHTNSRMVKQRPFFGWLKRLMKKRRFDGILPTNRHNYSGSSGGAASAR